MSKCRKTKNPCKICLRQVTRKTGLQCEGACESWVHYECLNYTPGKIQDIKKKVIRVSCPCPDCKSTLPKEHRLVEPFTCTNPKCPANLPPRCKNEKCPMGAIPDEKFGCSLSQCGTGCKQNVSEMQICRENLKPSPVPVNDGTGSPSHQDACTDCNSKFSRSSSHVSSDCCQSSRSAPDVSGDCCQTSASGIEDMCATVGQLTGQITDLMHQMKAVLETKGRTRTQLKPCHCPGNPCRK